MVQIVIKWKVFKRLFRDQAEQQRCQKQVWIRELVTQLDKAQELLWKEMLSLRQGIEGIQLTTCPWWPEWTTGWRRRKARSFHYSPEKDHHISFCSIRVFEQSWLILNALAFPKLSHNVIQWCSNGFLTSNAMFGSSVRLISQIKNAKWSDVWEGEWGENCHEGLARKWNTFFIHLFHRQ